MTATTLKQPLNSPPTKLASVLAWLRWPLALSIVAYMFSAHRDGIDRIAQRDILWSWVAAAIGFRFLALMLGCLRWWLLVRAQDIPVSLRDATRMGALGNLFNLIVPGTVGGDLTKAVLIAREQPHAKTIVTATVILDRVLGLLCLLILGFGASLVESSLWLRAELAPALLLLAGGTVAGGIGLGLVLHPAVIRLSGIQACTRLPKVGGIVTQLLRAVELYQARKLVFVPTVLLCLIVHASNVATYFCCATALMLTADAPNFSTHLVIVPVAEVAASVLPLPGGIGAREGALQMLYVATGSSLNLTSAKQAGFYTAVGYSLVSVVVALLGGLLASALKRRERPVLAERETRLTPATAGA